MKYKPWAEMIVEYISKQEVDKALAEDGRYSKKKLASSVVNSIGSEPIKSANKAVLQKRLLNLKVGFGITMLSH